jgi:hypothetical protein
VAAGEGVRVAGVVVRTDDRSQIGQQVVDPRGVERIDHPDAPLVAYRVTRPLARFRQTPVYNVAHGDAGGAPGNPTVGGAGLGIDTERIRPVGSA